MIQLTTTPHKVLIVARPAQALEPLVDHLRQMSCAVEVAATADEALQSATALVPEIVILYDHLPDTTPVELTLRLRSVLRDPAPGVSVDAAPGLRTRKGRTPGHRPLRPMTPVSLRS